MADEPEGFEVLPDPDEPLSADEAFGLLEESPEPFTSFDPAAFDDDEVLIGADVLAPLGRSWAFDFGTRRLLLARGRGPLETRGDATLHVWIEKCLSTHRGAHAIYSDDYGLEQPFDLIGKPVAALASSDLESRVREALLFHPRITNVIDFVAEFDEVAEALWVNLTVVRDDSDEMVLQGLRLA